MSDKVILCVFVIVWLCVSNAFFIAYVVGVARLLRIEIRDIGFGFPTVVSLNRGGCTYQWGPVPLNAYVRPYGVSDSDQEPMIPTATGRRFDKASVWAQLLIYTASSVALLILTLSLLPTNVVVERIVGGFQTLLLGTLDPFGVGEATLRQFAILAKQDPSLGFGVIAAAFFPWSLMPVSGTTTWALVGKLREHIFGASEIGRLGVALYLLGFMAAAAPYAAWGVALIAYLLS